MNVYPDGQAPSLLLLEKVARRPDVEGTPCGIAVLKKTFKPKYCAIAMLSYLLWQLL